MPGRPHNKTRNGATGIQTLQGGLVPKGTGPSQARHNFSKRANAGKIGPRVVSQYLVSVTFNGKLFLPTVGFSSFQAPCPVPSGPWQPLATRRSWTVERADKAPLAGYQGSITFRWSRAGSGGHCGETPSPKGETPGQEEGSREVEDFLQ